MHYLSHTKLTLPVSLDTSCIDVPCGETTTCMNGNCVPALIDECGPSASCNLPDAGRDARSFIVTQQRSLGGAGDDQVGGLARDPSGLLYAAGTVVQKADVGVMILAPGASSPFTASYDAMLGFRWAHVPRTQSGTGVGAAISANTTRIATGGTVTGTVDFGLGASSVVSAGFYTTHGPDGSLDHARLIGSSGEYGLDVAIDSASNVYVVGQCAPASQLAGLACTSQDGYLVSYDANDALRWSRLFGGGGVDSAIAVAVSSGTVLVGGRVRGAVDFGTGTIQSGGADSAFVAAYDTAGTPKWARVFGATGSARVNRIATNGSAIFAVGVFDGSIIEAGTTLSSAGSNDAFVWKLDMSGGGQWIRRLGGPLDDRALAVSADDTGGVHVCGSFQGSVDFGNRAIASNGSSDMFVVSIAADTSTRSLTFGGPAADECHAIIAESPTALVLGGVYANTIDFGAGPLTSYGGTDGFIVRLTRE